MKTNSKEEAGKRRWGCVRRGCGLLALILLLALLFPWLWQSWIAWQTERHVYSPDAVPRHQVAIVFGAAVYADGRLSPMLRDRVETSIQLYQSGKVDRLLFSGDNSSANYNEPDHMVAYALARGVPAEAIQPDYAGRRTYDTCYRARHIFQVEEAVLVTQQFHLPRALFTCREVGIEAVGVTADRRAYHPRSLTWSENREVAALLRALYDVVRGKPAAVLGEPIPLR